MMFESDANRKKFAKLKKELGPDIVQFCQDTINDCNKFKSLSYIITIDSGSLHLAQFCNIPSSGLYGPTDPCETGPYPTSPPYKHNRIIGGERTNNNQRIDKNVVLDEVLDVDHVFDGVCKHLRECSIVMN